MKKRRWWLLAALVVLIVALALLLWQGAIAVRVAKSQTRWVIISRPSGNFNTAAEYLDQGRLPSRIERVEFDGQTHWIAYNSPIDEPDAEPWIQSWGPAAYVFGPDGTMVDWALQSRCDAEFEKKWLPRKAESVSQEEFAAFALRSRELGK